MSVTFDRGLTSAPRLQRVAAIASPWFSAAAQISAVSPSTFSCAAHVGAVGRELLIAAALPLRAASISTVWPLESDALASAAGGEQHVDHRRVAVRGGERTAA